MKTKYLDWDADYRDENGNSVLHLAAVSRDLNVLSYWLSGSWTSVGKRWWYNDSLMKVDTPGAFGGTALLALFKFSQDEGSPSFHETLRLLLQAGADPFARNNNDECALAVFRAIGRALPADQVHEITNILIDPTSYPAHMVGRAEKVEQALLQYVTLQWEEEKRNEWAQGLVTALQANDLPAISNLLAAGANPAIPSREGGFPLYLACKAGNGHALNLFVNPENYPKHHPEYATIAATLIRAYLHPTPVPPQRSDIRPEAAHVTPTSIRAAQGATHSR